MELPPLLEPWVYVATDGDALVAELQREISPEHPLFGRVLRALARRQDCDDVLFVTIDDPVVVAVTHLTWSGSRETDSRWPGTSFFASLDDWSERCMKADHADFEQRRRAGRPNNPLERTSGALPRPPLMWNVGQIWVT